MYQRFFCGQDMEKYYINFNKGQLVQMFENIEEEITDLEIERGLALGGTVQHIGAREAEALKNQLDREKEKLMQKKFAIEKAINSQL